MKLKNEELDKVLRDFFTLKKIRRTGWQLRGIKECESIADHCFGVVFLTHFLAPLVEAKLDREKAVSIAIVHEIGETRIGDIPFVALKYFQNKEEIETQAIEDVVSPLGIEAIKESIKLFREFEYGLTIEGRFVKAIDKLEMLATAAEYEKTGFSSLKDFWENKTTFKAFDEFPELKSYAKFLLENRNKRIEGRINDTNFSFNKKVQ